MCQPGFCSRLFLGKTGLHQPDCAALCCTLQVLYFDRYTRILAPQLQVFTDDRINVRGLSSQYGIR